MNTIVKNDTIEFSTIKRNNVLSKMLIFLVLEVTSFLSLCACLLSDFMLDEYRYMLPASFLLSNSFLFFKVVVGNLMTQLPKCIVIVLLFLRNVVTPWVMLTDSFQSVIGLASYQDATHASILIAYETLILFLVIAFYRGNLLKMRISFDLCFKNKIVVYKVLMYGSVFICISALIFIDEFRTQYYTIFTNDITHLVKEKANYSSGSLLRILATGGTVLMGAVRLVLPSVLIYIIAKKDTLLRLFLCVLMVFVQCLFMNDSNAYILMLMFSQLLFIYYLFPCYRNLIEIYTTIIVVGFFILLYINRFALDHYGTSISRMLQAYIPSIANTASLIKMDSNFNFLQIFTDIFQAIPFKNFIWGSIEEVESTTMLWSQFNDVKGQIISTVGEGYFYFGSFLSPILSCLIIMVSIDIYGKIHTTDNALLLAVYLYFAVYCAVAPICYNFEIFMQCVLNRLIFMLVIARYSPYSMKVLFEKGSL